MRSLGVPGKQIPPHLEDRAALYRNRLAGTRTLIVLDNARTADQVRPLLPADPGCLVLVTSRRRLTALDEAQPISLDVLPVSDALSLFSRVAGPGRITGTLADTETASRASSCAAERQNALTSLFDHYRSTAAAAIDILYSNKSHRRRLVTPAGSTDSTVRDPVSARAWLDSERHNLVATSAYAAANGWPNHATQLATTIFRYLDQRGHFPEGLAIHSHARAAAAQIDDQTVDYRAEGGTTAQFMSRA